jgi:hypothetical protein
MPDLDQLLDTLVADVTAGTRAPGAPAAIKQAGRRRAEVAVAAAAAVAVIAVGGGLAAGTLGDSDRISPAGEPTLSPSEQPTAQESTEPSLRSEGFFETEFRGIVAQVPGWSIADTQPMFKNAPCAGDWSSASAGFGGGSFDVVTNGEPGQVWHEVMGFPSAAAASDAVERLVDNLTSCNTVAWHTEPIAETGAVLASSADGLIWVHQDGEALSILEAATTDGPPPLDVQVEVAEWMAAYNTWLEQG